MSKLKGNGMERFDIRAAGPADRGALLDLMRALWPDSGREELERELAARSPDADVCFIARQDRLPVGFARCSLRREYVAGASASPVGYLEGIYVVPEFRGRHCAAALLAACEDWTRAGLRRAGQRQPARQCRQPAFPRCGGLFRSRAGRLFHQKTIK